MHPGLDAGTERKRVVLHHEKILELLVCFLHPVAVVLLWLNLSARGDLTGGEKLAWGIVALMPLVPFLYVLAGGDLW